MQTIWSNLHYARKSSSRELANVDIASFRTIQHQRVTHVQMPFAFCYSNCLAWGRARSILFSPILRLQQSSRDSLRTAMMQHATFD
eukprot:3083906-Amphidinium_carterae.1